jgi:hypothetical protein
LKLALGNARQLFDISINLSAPTLSRMAPPPLGTRREFWTFGPILKFPKVQKSLRQFAAKTSNDSAIAESTARDAAN